MRSTKSLLSADIEFFSGGAMRFSVLPDFDYRQLDPWQRALNTKIHSPEALEIVATDRPVDEAMWKLATETARRYAFNQIGFTRVRRNGTIHRVWYDTKTGKRLK